MSEEDGDLFGDLDLPSADSIFGESDSDSSDERREIEMARQSRESRPSIRDLLVTSGATPQQRPPQPTLALDSESSSDGFAAILGKGWKTDNADASGSTTPSVNLTLEEDDDAEEEDDDAEEEGTSGNDTGAAEASTDEKQQTQEKRDVAPVEQLEASSQAAVQDLSADSSDDDTGSAPMDTESSEYEDFATFTLDSDDVADAAEDGSGNEEETPTIVQPESQEESSAADYSGLFDEEGEFREDSLDIDNSPINGKRKGRPAKRKRMFNLKRRRRGKAGASSFTEVPTGEPKAAGAGIARLMKEDAAGQETGKKMKKQIRDRHVEERAARRKTQTEALETAAKDTDAGDIASDLISAVHAKRDLSDRAGVSNSSQAKEDEKAPQPRPSGGASGPLAAAAALENAAAALEVTQTADEKRQGNARARVIVNRRRKTITDAPELVKKFGDLVKMLTIIHVVEGKGVEPRQEDKFRFQEFIEGSNRFCDLAKELAADIKKLFIEFFTLHENTAMVKCINSLEKDTYEIHQRPTVRKVPGRDAISAWSGDKLTSDSIKEMASLILRPHDEKKAQTCTIVTPKGVPGLLAVIHGALHLQDYIKNHINNGLAEVEGLRPDMRWGEIWKVCVGQEMSTQRVFAWPKGRNSKHANAFTGFVVTAREFVHTALFIRDEVEKAVATLKQDEESDEVESDGRE